MDDAKDLLSWKNDPVTREFSIVTHDEIKWENHLKYLENHIQDIMIIELDGRKCGDIRVDDEVSIRLAPECRGKGIGYRALKMVVEPGMIAHIVYGNVASMRLFTKLGFMAFDHGEGYYKLKL